jgi:hypothetical protein
MTRPQLARDLHDLWERAQSMHFAARKMFQQSAARDPFRRLALELALQDLVSFAGRAAALADLAEGISRQGRKR